MKVLAYARYSGSAQSKGTSVERQVEMIEAYALANGLAITEPPLIDRGRSAFHAAHIRGKMGQLLKRATSGDLGQGDIILVEVIDRMSREEVLVAWDQLRVFTNAGVTIITVAEQTIAVQPIGNVDAFQHRENVRLGFTSEQFVESVSRNVSVLREIGGGRVVDGEMQFDGHGQVFQIEGWLEGLGRDALSAAMRSFEDAPGFTV